MPSRTIRVIPDPVVLIFRVELSESFPVLIFRVELSESFLVVLIFRVELSESFPVVLIFRVELSESFPVVLIFRVGPLSGRGDKRGLSPRVACGLFFQETKQSIQCITNCRRFLSFSSSVSLEVPAVATSVAELARGLL
jgi:hypothetical protein